MGTDSHTPGDLEVDVRGRHERSEASDPKFYVLLGGDEGSATVIADTLNCDFMLTLDEQKANLERIALAWNSFDAMKKALNRAGPVLLVLAAMLDGEQRREAEAVIAQIRAALAKASAPGGTGNGG